MTGRVLEAALQQAIHPSHAEVIEAKRLALTLLEASLCDRGH